MQLNETDWADSDSEDENNSNIDAVGTRYGLSRGWTHEHGLAETEKTQWVSLPWVDVPRPNYSGDDYERSVYAFCTTVLVQPERMSSAPPDFTSIPFEQRKRFRSTMKMYGELFDKTAQIMKPEYQGKGIWGTDSKHGDKSDDKPWVLVIERFHVFDDARRQGWGIKVATRLLSEVVALAREAGKAVIVLAEPLPEVGHGAMSASRIPRLNDEVRVARAFWRSIGFVRLGETQFFGWTRSVRGTDSLVVKSPVRSEDLERDAEIDRRYRFGGLF